MTMIVSRIARTMSQATKSINHSVVHLGRLIVPKVKQKKLVWSDEANKLVWQFIEPKIYREFPLKDAAKAHRLMDSSAHIGKIVLTV